MKAFVFIHSPRVGPLTWALVADEVRRHGYTALVSALPDSRYISPPYWKRHAEAIAQSVESTSQEHHLILVGHSGAGPLLPAIREALNRSVAAYVFVDAAIPRAGASRFDLFESSEAVRQFSQAAVTGLLPTWGEEDLRDDLPNAELRRRFVAELRPLPVAVYEEPLPVFVGWPDAPCAYLHFSSFYESPAAWAQQAGWAYTQLKGGHFHMLVDPLAVAEALLRLVSNA
jgi:hypothetical protein